MTLKLQFHKNSVREGSNHGEHVREMQWTLDSFIFFCSDSIRQKQNRDWRWAEKKKKRQTGILSMPSCEKAAGDKLLEVVENEEK